SLSIDQIVPEAQVLMEEARTGVLGLDRLASVIVLDGLKIEMFREGPPGLGQPVVRRPPLSELASVFERLHAQYGSAVVIAIESNVSSNSERNFRPHLPPRCSFWHLQVLPLTIAESVGFLKANTHRSSAPPD